ncbi:sugar fermentation stimulation protein [Desulfosporosinus orientis DSM 765]|uniref:Sugar fermentation stimulation protein homolog n=1 Tax=Desulfosporosinus orientis (strain ATCC 19365 / DSM 765 / NCIMB 8382 / VKM B-1628 / Singapore I) TaxID=768706 RepID=G7WFG0_DESOD|nr:DNA/RNA nuclease SfsA [Desulfosporosinus orientis]AET68403.1 sugar fermentation stimulation protein [Desulfosporosinus orientis DSM 765]
MKYPSAIAAKFLKRPNRFIAHVLLDNHEEIVHVKNTGRCKELLQEGNVVILEESNNPKRKTKYSLIAVYKGNLLINIDSQVPNTVVYQGIQDGNVKELHDVTVLSREVVFGNSRFDLYFETKEKKGFIEVKGVTLETDGIAMFPDAPTLRGTKHLYEMVKAVEAGYAGYVVFLIQMKGVKYFKPFEIRDPEFTKALKLAAEKGVKVLAYDSIVSEDEITLGTPVDVRI